MRIALKAIEIKNCSGGSALRPKQTTNDEGTVRDLQIRHEEGGGAIFWISSLELEPVPKQSF